MEMLCYLLLKQSESTSKKGWRHSWKMNRKKPIFLCKKDRLRTFYLRLHIFNHYLLIAI